MRRIQAAGLVVFSALAILSVGRSADAEVLAGVGGPGFRGFGVGVGLGYGGYGYGGYGSGGGTVAGNYLNGMSNVIRSEGQYNLLTSQAGVNNEEARSRYLDNKKKWWENYLQMSEQRSAIDAQRYAAARHSPEALNAAAKSGLPKALGPDMLDPVTGRITWPEVLEDNQYADQRKEIEQLFELRAKTSHGAGTGQKIRTATGHMSEMLRKQIKDIPANDYIAARKFLDSLDFAAR
jgi:hypothetical protein